ncbi:MAG: isoprenylcysteine carboxylmethyltransferase family protein [Terrimesophilobacter sp.]
MTASGTAKAGAAALVILQLLLLAALVLAPFGGWWPRNPGVLAIALLLTVVGLVIAAWGILGLGPALTASPIPKEHTTLVTGGLYGIVRNPIYSGLMIIGFGLLVFGASWWHLATWAALIVLLAVKARWEERMLEAAHPDFAVYAARVGRFLPGIGLRHSSASQGKSQGKSQ